MFFLKSVQFDSYMLLEEDLKLGDLRLLEVDNILKIPAYTHVHFLITSADVLHS
jgi:cytochrome c oxidase subunit 2